MKFENIFKETEENLRLALLSLWAPGNHPMRPAIEELFDREPLLAEPVFQSTFGWEPSTDDAWRSAINKEVWNKLEKNREQKAIEAGKTFHPFNPFKHQAESWKTLAGHKSIVVTSGTGSGKTECFMYPVISDLYEQGRTNAIEAIFLYPLNALMEDQKKRLSDYCKATGLHFAVYNGDTPQHRQRGNNQVMPNEVATREEIRDNEHRGTRPEILLTNPSMLEYILVRKKDQQMIQESRGRLRWIIIDEAHSYSGSAAVELAFQIKRILNAFDVRPEDVRFACTSATIGGEDGARSLAEFISTITGQAVDRISVIGGNRLVRNLDEQQLERNLQERNLPAVDRVISLRNKINDVSGMTLQQMWEWLLPDRPYDKNNPIPALELLDELFEMRQEDNPVLSLRGHFFMRSINGIYACANPDCTGVNGSVPLYGHLTTYKSSLCPHCGAPLLEIVKCKRCNSFVLMGYSDSQTHKVSQCEEDVVNNDDYFGIELPIEQEEAEELSTPGTPSVFFLKPYDREHFSNPVSSAIVVTTDFMHNTNITTLEVNQNREGSWVEVRNTDGHSYCPECGRLAQGSKLNLKHFRIPIDFINQAIAPVFLKECAPKGHSWGKYIVFTDSRQGTAISAKTFNINVERTNGREKILQELANNTGNQNTITIDNIPGLTEAQRTQILAQLNGNNPQGKSLHEVSNCLFDFQLFNHIAGRRNTTDETAYKAALLRQYIGRKSLYENTMENMGIISLVYPALNNIKRPNSIVDYSELYGLEISDQDWRDFLKIALDYFFRVGNHIQPLVRNEKKYIRESSLGTPVAPADDDRIGVAHWPTVNEDNDGVTLKQHRLILLLCAGLNIYTQADLQQRKRFVANIMHDAWQYLIDNNLLKIVRADDTEGYNHRRNDEYVGCYYLDLSGNETNHICRIRLAQEVKLCPISIKIVDTTFRGYSPYMTGELSKGLFDKYKCTEENIQMPTRPADNDGVDEWLEHDENVAKLKEKGLWSDRHKYSYKKYPVYIAAEHSAQQSKTLLQEYTRAFTLPTPGVNVLHCSTTMEMGVDIGDIDLVLMDTVPPTAANYLQRVGRAGRMGQTKAVAFSLCSNTPVGQNAFANPMWALQTTNRMIPVRSSQIIIQRHVNSFFFRQYICEEEDGLLVTSTIDEFMTQTYDRFVRFLNNKAVDQDEEQIFHRVFGDDVPYTINATINSIQQIQQDYSKVINELRDAFVRFKDDQRRMMAISNQIRKLESENLLTYLSEHQFIPNANMPTGIATFDFTDNEQAQQLHSLFTEYRNLAERKRNETDPVKKYNLEVRLNQIMVEIEDIKRATTASRDIRTALNEYAPEQTVVVNEKNYVSAGISLFGAYNQETQTRAIYHCIHCGHTEYRETLDEHLNCPICNNPYHGIIDRNRTGYTLAYEPVGFRTDQNINGSREEKTNKRYYDIRPVLLNTDWNGHQSINMCEMVSSGDSSNILFYNVGIGYGFAFCKKCGRAAIEQTNRTTAVDMPESVKQGHKCLWGGDCDANNSDIARHVVFTGNHPTCYTILRFKQKPNSQDYVTDEQLVYSLGVVLKRALAKSEGIDEGEIDFGIKQEINATLLFMYDTAKGGCGYSLKLSNPVLCQEIFDAAKREIEGSNCNCHIDGGACTKCLIDRSNYRNVDLLSKQKVLDWLNLQNGRVVTIPEDVRLASPDARIVYKPLKEILKLAINDPDVRSITICASDITDDYAVTDWSSIRSKMGRLVNTAVTNGIQVTLSVEYHPELHSSLSEKLPFIRIGEKFPDCRIRLISDMGAIKTAVILESINETRRYFTNEDSVLSFSNHWGDECMNVFVDSETTLFRDQEEPTYTAVPSQIIREGITRATSFQVKDYFSAAIAPYVLNAEDIDTLKEILRGKEVNITFSDMYVNSALASLMLTYLIDELRRLFGFRIENILLMLDSPKRRCENERFNNWTNINMNFPDADDADEYTEALIQDVLGIDPDFSFDDAVHHRWLKIETQDGGLVEIRPDHGISGGYKSDSKYMNLDTLSGSVRAFRNDDEILYYVIMKRPN